MFFYISYGRNVFLYIMICTCNLAFIDRVGFETRKGVDFWVDLGKH